MEGAEPGSSRQAVREASHRCITQVWQVEAGVGKTWRGRTGWVTRGGLGRHGERAVPGAAGQARVTGRASVGGSKASMGLAHTGSGVCSWKTSQGVESAVENPGLRPADHYEQLFPALPTGHLKGLGVVA